MDAPFECGPEDANVAAFVKAALIISGCDAMLELPACGICPLSESCVFEVKRKEISLSKVMVPMLKLTPTIGKHELETALKAWIAATANMLIVNYCVTEHNSCTGLRHGQLNRVFELADVLCQPHPKPIAHVSKKR
jgi:hypothetical protein